MLQDYLRSEMGMVENVLGPAYIKRCNRARGDDSPNDKWIYAPDLPGRAGVPVAESQLHRLYLWTREFGRAVDGSGSARVPAMIPKVPAKDGGREEGRGWMVCVVRKYAMLARSVRRPFSARRHPV